MAEIQQHELEALYDNLKLGILILTISGCDTEVSQLDDSVTIESLIPRCHPTTKDQAIKRVIMPLTNDTTSREVTESKKMTWEYSTNVLHWKGKDNLSTRKQCIYMSTRYLQQL